MKLETFFDKFDQLADAPTAIDDLRKIVLRLAVQGSLVEQSDEDEPASEMLRRLGTRQLLLLDSTDLPTQWAKVALGDLLTLQKGKKPSSLNTDGLGLPYLDIAALERGELRQFTEDDKCPRATSGDLIIVCDGSRSGLVLDGVAGVLGSTVSKVGYAGFVRDYLKLFLRSLYDDLNGAKKGAAIPHLNIPRLLALPAPIPPLAEQDRIVAKVDELMALCDRLEAQQQERETRQAALARASLARFADAPTADNLTLLFHKSYNIPPADLRKAILSLAVQGKLVPQDPNDESVANLLAELTRLRAQLLKERKIRNQKVSDSPRPGDLPFEIPDEWQWIRLGQVITLLGGYAYESGAYVPKSSNQIIRLGNVKNDALLVDQKPVFIPDTLAQQTNEYAVLEGDILITMTGTKAKRDYAFTLAVKSSDLEERRLFLNQRVGAIRPFQPELVPLINVFLKADRLLDLVFATATGTANQANIGTSSILDLPFPFPPLSEQRRIVTKINQLMTLVDQLETQLAASRTIINTLVDAIVTELTTENRTYAN